MMLVMFKLKNFGPFKEECIFDMRAIKAYKEHPYNLIQENEDQSLLKVVGIYGANASGKSNFARAYKTFSSIVRYSFAKNGKEEKESVLEEYYHPFQLDEESYRSETEFEAIYYYGENEYRYGFAYHKKAVVYEWLYKKSLNTNRQTVILERNHNKFEFGASVRDICEKYESDIDHDVLALSFLSSLKLKTKVFRETEFCIKEVFVFSFSYDGQSEYFLQSYFEKNFDEKEKPNILRFLHAIDVGITDIEVEKNKDKVSVYTFHNGKDGKKYKFPLDIESDGTKRAIAIYSLVRIAVLFNCALIIDEFNNQLHPLLQKYILDLFYEDSTRGQLIYTTHDTTLMDKQYMRRDQIWFTDKNSAGESSIYSLAEFKIRNDKSFGKDYLSGVYGGIPILKEFSFKEDKNGD